jgi:hypothetical protein
MLGEKADAIAPAARASISHPYTLLRPNRPASHPNSHEPNAAVSSATELTASFWTPPVTPHCVVRIATTKPMMNRS